MDWRETPSLLPRASWDSPSSFRFCAMRCPMVTSLASFRRQTSRQPAPRPPTGEWKSVNPRLAEEKSPCVSMDSEGLFVAVEILPHKAHEEELRRSGVAVAQGGVRGWQAGSPPRWSSRMTVRPWRRASASQKATTCRAYPRPEQEGRMHRVWITPTSSAAAGMVPGDGAVLRQLDAVQVHHAPEDAVLLAHVEGAGLQGGGRCRWWGICPAPVGIDGALCLSVQDLLIDICGLRQVRGVASRIMAILLFDVVAMGKARRAGVSAPRGDDRGSRGVLGRLRRSGTALLGGRLRRKGRDRTPGFPAVPPGRAPRGIRSSGRSCASFLAGASMVSGEEGRNALSSARVEA